MQLLLYQMLPLVYTPRHHMIKKTIKQMPTRTTPVNKAALRGKPLPFQAGPTVVVKNRQPASSAKN